MNRYSLGAKTDDGLTLVEVVIAMFLLAVIMVAMLPLLIVGVKASAENTTFATASQLVSREIELAQLQSPLCTTINELDGVEVITDPRAVQIQVTTTVVDNSDGGSAWTVTVTSTAIRAGSTQQLATSTTEVFCRVP